MHDRLRLNVAVSRGREIFSWYGEGKFTSSPVSELVSSGPISSGSFVGLLENIFVTPGVGFGYLGRSQSDNTGAYRFEYSVPLAYSAYRVQGHDTRRSSLVAYHGHFSVEGPDYHLVSLQIVTDAVPEDVHLCSVKTEITYQTVKISNYLSLIPASFSLALDDDDWLKTISRNQYSQCHEFRGESTLHFDITDAGSGSPAPRKPDAQLPAGISSHVRLQTLIDNHTSYVGDAVEGVLIKSFKVPGTELWVPEGAVLHGILTQLESHYIVNKYQLFSVQFNSMSFQDTSFLLNASPETSKNDKNLLRQMYGSPLPALMADNEQRGLFVHLAPRPHVDHLSAAWITRVLSGQASSSQ